MAASSSSSIVSSKDEPKVYRPPLSPHALVTVQAVALDDTTIRYASSPSAHSIHNIGKCGKESLSFVLKPHFASAMYGYLKLEILQHEAGTMRPEIGSIVIFFKNIKGLQWEILDKDATRTELQVLNPNAKAKTSSGETSSSSLKIKFTTAQAGFDMTNKDFGRLREMNIPAGEDVDLLRKMIENANPSSPTPTSPLKLELLLAVHDDETRESMEEFCAQLEKNIQLDRSKKLTEWPLAPWFQGIDTCNNHPLSLLDVPRLGPGFPGTARQPAVARFVDVDHYWITQAVGSVNETMPPAKASTILLDARIFKHAKISIDYDQFFILVSPEEEAGVNDRTNNTPATALRNTCEIQLLVQAWRCGPACSGPHEWSVWMSAQCFDDAISWVPEGTHVYLVDLPCTPRIRGNIGRSLVLMELMEDVTTYESLKHGLSQQTFKIQMRSMESYQTTKAEMDTLQLLSNQSNFQTPHDLPIRAFNYLLNFSAHPDTPTVNLWKKLPGLANLVTGSQRNYQGSPLEWLNRSLREHQRLFGSFQYLTAGMAFMVHDHDTDVIEFVLCIIAAATFGIRKEQIDPDKNHKRIKTRADWMCQTPLMCSSLFVSSTKDIIDGFAKEAQEFFTEHNFGSMPGILVISTEDATIASAFVMGDMPNISLSPVACGAANKDDAEIMDVAGHFLMQTKLSGGTWEGEAPRASLSGRLTIHEASYQYYLMTSSEFPRIEKLVADIQRGKELCGAESFEFRTLAKKLYAVMLTNFKGIVCTLPTTAAHPWVQNFDPDMVFVGDAGRIRELSSLIPIAHYLPDAWMFFGCLDDEAPLVDQETSNKENPFLNQLEVSLLERAVRCGKSHGRLEWPSKREEISD